MRWACIACDSTQGPSIPTRLISVSIARRECWTHQATWLATCTHMLCVWASLLVNHDSARLLSLPLQLFLGLRAGPCLWARALTYRSLWQHSNPIQITRCHSCSCRTGASCTVVWCNRYWGASLGRRKIIDFVLLAPCLLLCWWRALMARAVIMGGGFGRLTELRMLGDADFVEKFDAFGLSCGGKETVLRHLLGLVA